MDCKIYFQCNAEALTGLKGQLTQTFNFIRDKFSTMIFNDFEIYIRPNDEADTDKASLFPDGFLYFNYYMELYFETNRVEKTNQILAILWSNLIPAVAVCDYEDMLYEKGGYKSKKIPWEDI